MKAVPGPRGALHVGNARGTCLGGLEAIGASMEANTEASGAALIASLTVWAQEAEEVASDLMCVYFVYLPEDGNFLPSYRQLNSNFFNTSFFLICHMIIYFFPSKSDQKDKNN
jgi:hypothetical protein